MALTICTAATITANGLALTQATGNGAVDSGNVESHYDRFIPHLKPHETIMPPKKYAPAEIQKQKKERKPDQKLEGDR